MRDLVKVGLCLHIAPFLPAPAPHMTRGGWLVQMDKLPQGLVTGNENTDHFKDRVVDGDEF